MQRPCLVRVVSDREVGQASDHMVVDGHDHLAVQVDPGHLREKKDMCQAGWGWEASGGARIHMTLTHAHTYVGPHTYICRHTHTHNV